jgi:hypothetical protein
MRKGSPPPGIQVKQGRELLKRAPMPDPDPNPLHRGTQCGVANGRQIESSTICAHAFGRAQSNLIGANGLQFLTQRCCDLKHG